MIATVARLRIKRSNPRSHHSRWISKILSREVDLHNSPFTNGVRPEVPWRCGGAKNRFQHGLPSVSASAISSLIKDRLRANFVFTLDVDKVSRFCLVSFRTNETRPHAPADSNCAQLQALPCHAAPRVGPSVSYWRNFPKQSSTGTGDIQGACF